MNNDQLEYATTRWSTWSETLGPFSHLELWIVGTVILWRRVGFATRCSETWPLPKVSHQRGAKQFEEKTECKKFWLRYTLVRYEDLADRTEEMVKSLYARLGLRWTEKIRWRRNKHGPPIILSKGVQWGPTLRRNLGRTWWITEHTGHIAFEHNCLTGWDLYGLRP